MKYIQLGIHLTDELGIKSVTIDHNDTSLPSDSDLIKRVSMTVLKSLILNKEDVIVQDLINELGIEIEK